MNSLIKVAIDGPAGAGKSTVAKLIAQKLDIIYLDTGAMYRAIAFKYLNTNIDLDDKITMAKLLENTDLQIVFEHSAQKVILDGVDISDKIRTTEVSNTASRIATLPEVREKLVEIQRDIARESSVVMDGRDIGTHVLPNADVKIFLTASLKERANRRYAEYKVRDEHKTLDDVIAEIESRDRCDSIRDFAPLRMAEDAIRVDTTGKIIEQVVDIIIGIIDNKVSRN